MNLTAIGATAQPLRALRPGPVGETPAEQQVFLDRIDLSAAKAAPGLTLNTKTDGVNDGGFLGAGGKVFPASTPLDKIPAMLPNNGRAATETVYLVNGIMSDVALQSSDMQALANTGRRVIGIHNDTHGMVRDVAEAIGDKLDLKIAHDRAIDTAETVVRQAVQTGQPLRLIGHSQGALILCDAIKRVKRGLEQDGLSADEAAKKLSQVHVTTLGGSAFTFPKGPHYTHFVNNCDFVPLTTGLGVKEFLPAGQDSELYHFSEVNKPHDLPSLHTGLMNYMARIVDRAVHGMENVYLPALAHKEAELGHLIA